MGPEPMQVNVDKIDIEKVRDIPTIPQDERDLYTLLYEEASTPAHDTRGFFGFWQEMLSWMYHKSTSLEKQDFERYSSCWSGEGALQELERAGIQYQGFPLLSECAKKAVGAAAEAETDGSHLSGFAAGTLEGLSSVLNFMLRGNGIHLQDYRLVVQKYVKRDAELGVTGWVSSFSLWCMNPAVVFGEIASKARTVILTSGTLSPIGSFASELGVTFEVSMEAPHVIDMKTQVWSGVLTRGSGNIPLHASYKHADGLAFQDALGKTLEELFKVTPDGALVFFPSYKLLENSVIAGKLQANGIIYTS
ncbi:hypothetical protein L7F22_029549 [Adiantum nelumboides]|nr:hypothetical protein [Adiantum nelumboides]